MLGSTQVSLVYLLSQEKFSQTQEIRASWAIILGQLQRVGVQCIVDLFELHPFVKEHFRGILVNQSKVYFLC